MQKLLGLWDKNNRNALTGLDNKQNSSNTRGIHVLGIESSCDDTGVAIIDQDGKILSNCVHSQLKQHLNHGGIIPMVAKDYHLDNIDNVARKAFQESGLESVSKSIDAIAVTNRPGIDSSLQVGFNYAKTLAKKYSKPLIPIHHMQAHALMPLLQNNSIRFPFLALLISGGHCLLSICARYNKFHLLGCTYDEAPGDLLDKVGRRLKLKNLGPPFDRVSGGAAIELLSRRDGADRFKYFNDNESIPMLRKNHCDFSFTGYRGILDKHLLPIIDELWESGDRDKLLIELGHLCSSLQRVILIQLFRKLHRAMMYYRMHWRYHNSDLLGRANDKLDHLGFGVRNNDGEDDGYLDVLVSGGVAANGYLINNLRKACQHDIDSSINVYAPTKDLCSDNGLMIAWNGMLRYKDYLERGEQPVDLDESVIFDPEKMDLVKTTADCPIGCDISDLVRQADFKMEKTTSLELKIKKA